MPNQIIPTRQTLIQTELARIYIVPEFWQSGPVQTGVIEPNLSSSASAALLSCSSRALSETPQASAMSCCIKQKMKNQFKTTNLIQKPKKENPNFIDTTIIKSTSTKKKKSILVIKKTLSLSLPHKIRKWKNKKKKKNKIPGSQIYRKAQHN